MASSSVKIPNIVKHCAMAIFQDPKIRGTDKDRFETALKYAISRLTEYGYLAGSKEAKAEEVMLSQKGAVRDRHHSKEGADKSRAFDKLYQSLIKQDSTTEVKKVAREIQTKPIKPKKA